MASERRTSRVAALGGIVGVLLLTSALVAPLAHAKSGCAPAACGKTSGKVHKSSRPNASAPNASKAGSGQGMHGGVDRSKNGTRGAADNRPAPGQKEKRHARPAPNPRRHAKQTGRSRSGKRARSSGASKPRRSGRSRTSSASKEAKTEPDPAPRPLTARTLAHLQEDYRRVASKPISDLKRPGSTAKLPHTSRLLRDTSGTDRDGVVDAVVTFAFPLSLTLAVGLFLLFQGRIDRDDPKLVHAADKKDTLAFV